MEGVQIKLPSRGTEKISVKTENFVKNNSLVVLIIVLLVIAILAIWIIGSKNGDSIFKGATLPPGFPTYALRNVFTTLALILITIGVIFAVRTNYDFDNTIIVVMYSIFLGLVIALEATIQSRADWNGAALTSPIMFLALGFLVLFTWRGATWIRILLILGAIWFLFLAVEVLALKALNTTH